MTENETRAHELVDRIFRARGRTVDDVVRDMTKALDQAETRGVQRATIAQNAAHIDVVFEGRPDSPDLTFVEVEIDGRSVRVGEWSDPVGLLPGRTVSTLRITAGDVMAVQR